MDIFNPGDRVRVFAGYSITPIAVDYVGCTGTVLEVNPKIAYGDGEGLLYVKLDTTHPKTGMWSLILPTTDFERI